MSRRALNPCFVVPLGVLMLTGLTGCGMVARPSASIESVSIQNVGLTDSTMLFDVKVDNPYTAPLPIGNLDYALSSQGQEFLKGNADVQGTVPAGGSKTFAVPVRISYVELVNSVTAAQPGRTIPYRADLGLSVTTPLLGPLRVPMSKEGQLSIPSVPGLLERLKGAVK